MKFDPSAPSTWKMKPVLKTEKVVVPEDALSFRRTISNFFGSDKEIAEDGRE